MPLLPLLLVLLLLLLLLHACAAAASVGRAGLAVLVPRDVCPCAGDVRFNVHERRYGTGRPHLGRSSGRKQWA